MALTGEDALLNRLAAATALPKPVLWETGDITDCIANGADWITRDGDSTWETANYETYLEYLIQLTGTISLVNDDLDSGGNGAANCALKDGYATTYSADLGLILNVFDLLEDDNVDYGTAGLDALWDSGAYVGKAAEALYDRLSRAGAYNVKYAMCLTEEMAGLGYTAAEKAVRYERCKFFDNIIKSALPEATVIWQGAAPEPQYWSYALPSEGQNARFGLNDVTEFLGHVYGFTAEYPWDIGYTQRIYDYGQRICNASAALGLGWLTTSILYGKKAPTLAAGYTPTTKSSTWAYNGVEYATWGEWHLGYMFFRFTDWWNSSVSSTAALGYTDKFQGMTLLGAPFRLNDENPTYYKEWLIRFITMLSGAIDGTTNYYDDYDNWDHTFTQTAAEYI